MRRLTNITLTVLVVFAAVSGVATAQDFRSADARDSARQGPGTTGLGILNGRDLMSPDARDSARQANSNPTDLRSPDARDVAARPVTTYVAGRTSTPAQPVLKAAVDGFDWGDAGIGAAGMLALVALFAGTLMIASQRRRDRRFPVATR